MDLKNLSEKIKQAIFENIPTGENTPDFTNKFQAYINGYCECRDIVDNILDEEIKKQGV